MAIILKYDSLCQKEYLKLQEENQSLKEELENLTNRMHDLVKSFSKTYNDK